MQALVVFRSRGCVAVVDNLAMNVWHVLAFDQQSFLWVSWGWFSPFTDSEPCRHQDLTGTEETSYRQQLAGCVNQLTPDRTFEIEVQGSTFTNNVWPSFELYHHFGV
jgi:hypothetical protein